jgi:ATP-dependent Clp protease ATP-binding subunit ClpC
VVGQDEALETLTRALQRSRAGLKDPVKPIGSFIFAGPSGVGKTELAKVLAEFLFGDEKALVRVDMSEYMERFTSSRLVGSPPGYVGYDEGGQLTEKVRRRPYSVILFDEIEKAHPDVFNVLLQVLEDGHLTDGMGRKVDFRNTIIILTTNLGTAAIVKGGGVGFSNKEVTLDHGRMEQEIQSEMKRLFRPEFLNRIDQTIVFRALTPEDVLQVVDIQIERVNRQLRAMDLVLELAEEARQWLARKGYSPTSGARLVARTISKFVENPLSEKVLIGEIAPGMRLLATVVGDELHFEEVAPRDPVFSGS